MKIIIAVFLPFDSFFICVFGDNEGIHGACGSFLANSCCCCCCGPRSASILKFALLAVSIAETLETIAKIKFSHIYEHDKTSLQHQQNKTLFPMKFEIGTTSAIIIILIINFVSVYPRSLINHEG